MKYGYLGCWLAAGLLCVSTSVQSEVLVDIRSQSPLRSSLDSAQYVARLSDCSRVVSVSVGADGANPIIPAEMQRVANDSLACEHRFTLEGPQKLNPELRILTTDGKIQTVQEQFNIENQLPSVSLEGVAITEQNGQQLLNIKVNAQDNVDISYVALDIKGIRASALRAAGGVIAKAAKTAFADSGGYARLYPISDDQTQFSLSLPNRERLDGAAIAHDAIVLVNVIVEDASGNQSTYSDIVFVGDDVQENVEKLSVAPHKLIFSNALEEAQLVPSLNFQFRGWTPVPGSGNGMTYSSSNSDAVYVTEAGRVYPLKETGEAGVELTVRYAGQDPVTVPVVVNYSKQLTALKLAGIGGNHLLTLSSLNKYYALPEGVAVFDDGSEAPLTDPRAVTVTLPDSAKGILEYDKKQGLKALLAIQPDAAIPMRVALARFPEVNALINVSADDAPPVASLAVPGKVEVDSVLTVKASAEDDVGISDVVFFLDNQVLGRRQQLPYEINMPVSELMLGRKLMLRAQAKDTAGQVTDTSVSTVVVVDKEKPVIPSFQFELPAHNARIVEGTPYRMSVAHNLGVIPDSRNRSEISYVEFFADGQKVAESYYPNLEVRENSLDSETKELWEVWRADVIAPQIATQQTSLSLTARVHTLAKATADAEAKLVKLIQNSPPTLSVLSPIEGALATVGQTLDVVVQVADDTLSMRTLIELLLDGKVVASKRYQDAETKWQGAYTSGVHQETFKLAIEEAYLGRNLKLAARAIDYHEKAGRTDPITVQVKDDQLPSVAVSHPVEGQKLVSGIAVELRANATDDLGVAQVDFYVNGKLVGTDHRAPFAVIYETPLLQGNEQPLTVKAVAKDSRGQEAESQIVNVTLGKDEDPPVINLVSPTINETDAGSDIAAVVESSDVLIKFSGYDNVEVTALEVRGVKLVDGVGAVLTGNDSDVLTGQDFALQQIPGALRAYSALRLVRVPEFKNLEGVRYDRYQVSAQAKDEAGNSSTVSAVIGVFKDQVPVIRALTAN